LYGCLEEPPAALVIAMRNLFARIGKWIVEERLLIVSALLVTTILFGAIYGVIDRRLRSWTERDLDRRSSLVWRAVRSEAAVAANPPQLKARFEELSDEDRLIGILACWGDGRSLSNDALGGYLSCESPLARAAIAANGNAVSGRVGNHIVHLTAHRFGTAGAEWLLIAQDRGFMADRRRRLLQIVLIAAELALLTILLLARFGARLGRQRFSRSARDLLERVRAGDSVPQEMPHDLRPLARDVRDTFHELRLRRAGNGGESGPARLRRMVETETPDQALVVVANREPYVHEFAEDGSVRIARPASGLVSGIEPLLRACGGTWIAHGSGGADRESADANGRLPVPPESPEYVLRRVWLTEEEYDGYYYGFANEGLWPLCHIAHTRPTFRPSDWRAYQEANEKFARAIQEEGGADALVLVQDYHFALAPRFVRNSMPDAVVSLFWHIPWPNSEVIGICPWKEQILDGMLGADVVGFHTRFHCLNFLETAQRFLECRVDLESMSVEYNKQRTLVRPYPISIEWPYPVAPRHAGTALRQSLGIHEEAFVAIGVDRSDYTKGLLERMEAIETLLAANPDLVGRFVYVQLAAPSRTRIKRYRDVISDLEEAAVRINRRFGTRSYRPVVLQLRSFSPEEVRVYYAMGNMAVVTPLHDGMNLVAKEYAASCEDGDGVLVLSTFAGAAKELEGALIVNPYDSEDVANAIRRGIEMSADERRERMRMMREHIAKHSIYEWSAKLLRDMAEVRKRRDRAWSGEGAAVERLVAEVSREWR
jgi:trehalose 6-phosphate synthase